MKRILTWIPVVLLPVSNLALIFLTGVEHDVTSVIPWIIGAVAEEMFFRLFLLKTIFRPRMKPALAIFLVSVLFAAMHLLNLRNEIPLPTVLAQMFCAFCFSTWAGAVVWRKGSILIPMLAHVLLNLTAMTEGTLIPLLVSAMVLADGILLMKGNENEQ